MVEKLRDAEINPLGILEETYVDSDTGLLREVISQPITGILDNNTALRNLNNGYSPEKTFKRVASIPIVLAEQWKRELGIDVMDRLQWPRVKKLLEDADFMKLRTADIKTGI